MSAWPSESSRSKALYDRASRVFAGGITRIQPWQDPFPIYAGRGEGAYVIDVDGTRRLDLVNNFASLIHGHAHPAVVEAARERIGLGTAFTLPTESEVALAELLSDRVPGFEWFRFCNSGSEAVMVAIKAARAFTGRPKIVKMEGVYHGSYDYAEVSLDPNPSNWGNDPASVGFAKGTPRGVLEDVVVVPFNDPEAARRIIRAQGSEIAAVLLDAAPSYLGFLPATREFLDAVAETAREVGALVILDEVITFRFHHGGIQTMLGIEPDLTTLAKIIGGGFPVGAVAGRREVMSVFDHRPGKPPLPASGTFSANPVTMVAGRVTMEMMTPEVYDRLDLLGARLRAGVDAAFARAGYPGRVTGLGSAFKIHLSDRPFTDYRSALPTPAEETAMLALQRGLLDEGFILSTKGMGFLSTVMTEAEIDAFVDATGWVLGRLAA